MSLSVDLDAEFDVALMKYATYLANTQVREDMLTLQIAEQQRRLSRYCSALRLTKEEMRMELDAYKRLRHANNHG